MLEYLANLILRLINLVYILHNIYDAHLNIMFPLYT